MVKWWRPPTDCPGSVWLAPDASSGPSPWRIANFIIHQYDEINRELTWLTVSRNLPGGRSSLALLFVEVLTAIEDDSD